MADELKQCIANYWRVSSEEELDKIIAGLSFPCESRLDCGTVETWATADDVPRASTICSCGNPAHWLVVIERTA
jgi:hypothetical protein